MTITMRTITQDGLLPTTLSLTKTIMKTTIIKIRIEMTLTLSSNWAKQKTTLSPLRMTLMHNYRPKSISLLHKSHIKPKKNSSKPKRHSALRNMRKRVPNAHPKNPLLQNLKTHLKLPNPNQPNRNSPINPPNQQTPRKNPIPPKPKQPRKPTHPTRLKQTMAVLTPHPIVTALILRPLRPPLQKPQVHLLLPHLAVHQMTTPQKRRNLKKQERPT